MIQTFNIIIEWFKINMNQHTTFTFGLSTLLIATTMGTVSKRLIHYLNISAPSLDRTYFNKLDCVKKSDLRTLSKLHSENIHGAATIKQFDLKQGALQLTCSLPYSPVDASPPKPPPPNTCPSDFHHHPAGNFSPDAIFCTILEMCF